MQPCAFANAVTGGAVILLGAFAGCTGGDRAPPESAEQVAAQDAPSKPRARRDSVKPTRGESSTQDADGSSESSGATPASTSDAKPGKRDPKEIQEVVLAHRKPIRKCYEVAHAKIPGLKGTMTMKIVIRPDGTVKSVSLNRDRSDVFAPALVDCATEHLKKLTFGHHPSGMDSTVDYPFDFKPPQ